MGWSIGYDTKWKRDIGYGVPAVCDHLLCDKEIHRGLAYVCGGEPFGGESGCGLHFCEEHLYIGGGDPQMCERCCDEENPCKPTADHPTWINHKLTHESWQQWRDDNPDEVARLREVVNKNG